ncbi:hypothetical protein PHLGIDRAFT_125828 [Phlebiopsis gigantea 11061_1 CR5-6]|uniref:Uncharacterized protein n=1 Tax=Phlebiopsis gigantea (strain 11061_1 CR5-6) TaxID=745531 RepID=A0A0C3SBF6_PHLG1|nr:hypothetical protein PHLGIDRAFT_125828 [Phlebiopsis gigantea 11061_1 CR5-6]
MDDLYNNAWGDSSDFYASTRDYASSSQTTWVPPSPTSPQHEEADLANPSWSTGADVKWNEPSDHEQSHGFAWSATDPDLAWGTSTYEDIGLGKRKSSTPDEDKNSEVDEEPVDDEGVSTKSGPIEPIATLDNLRTHSPESPQAESPPSSPDQDGFGTFEDATAFDDVTVASRTSTGLEEEPWSSPWAGVPAPAEEEKQPIDEWEVARRTQERLDRLVPPEVLANIINQCEEYFKYAVAKTTPMADAKVKDTAKEEAGEKVEQEVEELAPEEAQKEVQQEVREEIQEETWMNDWRSGIEGIEGLDTLMQSLVPELILQPAPIFTKTGIAKNMASSVRLSKHLSLSKASPMFHYMAARGSTAWETAVKHSKDTVEEDVVPVGWRIVEKQNQPESESPSMARTSSGLFSFWSKRQSKTPVPIATPKEASPSRGSMSSIPSADAGTPRMSVDSSHTRSVSVSSDKDRQPSSVPSPAPTPGPVEPSRASTVALAPTPSPTQSTSSYADAPDLTADAEAQTPQQPPPSAVSRFLGRFSRKRSSLGSSSPRSSLALSTDDLEFLSDIVPSAADGHEEHGDSFESLNSILKPEPLPPALPPPPLAPPPRPASVATLPSQLINTAASGSNALIDTVVTASQPPSARKDQDDLEDIFGEFETSPTSFTSSGIDPFAASVPVTANTTRVPIRTQTPIISVPQARISSPLSFTGPPLSTRSDSQPSVRPLLAVPSVIMTPAIAPPPTQRADTEPLFDSMSRRQQSRPKAPISFTLSKPSGPVSPGLPSASEVPLAQLYPEAAARQHAQQSGSSSMPVIAATRSASPFPSPPSQPSRSHTPIMVRAPLNPGIVAPLLAPPPGTSSQATAPTVNLLGGDDDDDFGDFEDFHSSAPTTASTLGPQKSTFSFPPPPPSATTKPAIKPSTLAPLIPPTSSGSKLISSPSTPQPLSSESLNDDFAAMLLSSSRSLDSHRSHVSGLNISFQSDQSLLTSQKKGFSFEDFAASTSSVLRTPSPPRPISKSSRPPMSLELPKIAHPATVLSSEEKEARASSHQRTLSLLERAAARPGQWPAPPSPLPQAISFPILGGPAPKQKVDLLGDDDAFSAFQSDAPSPAPPAANGPKVEPAPASANLAHTWSSFAPVASKVQETTKLNGSSASKPSGGGLSAQDLSFFEGL